jgi:ribosomal protein L7/L12
MRFFGWFRKPTVAMIVAKHPSSKFDAIKEVCEVYKLGLKEARAAVELEDAYFFEEVVTTTRAPQCPSIEEEDLFFFDEAEGLDSELDFSDDVAGSLEGDLCAWKEAAEGAGSTEPPDFEPDEEWKEANAQANEEASEASSLETLLAAKAEEQIEAIIAEAVAAYPDQKVAAIKQVRILTGLGLKEAKAAVDEVWHEPKKATTIGDLIRQNQGQAMDPWA